MKKKQKLKKVASFGFLLAIPSLYIVILILSIAAAILFSYYTQDREKWSIFIACGIASTSLIASSKIYKLRILVHELKHAVVVILTGNKLEEIKVGEQEGHVTYLMYWNKKHFAPLITLAPYFLPLFSAPVLAIGLFYEKDYPLLISALLGIGLSADITFGIQDLHPAQTDLKKILGGFFTSALFLVGMYLSWTLTCILWLIAGKKAFIFVFYGLYRFTNDFIVPQIV